MSGLASGLFVGAVIHRRLRPRRHRLRYRLFQLLVDLDELPALDRSLRLFSHNRFNLFSLRDEDYAERRRAPLRQQVEAQLRLAGMAPPGGPIRLLTMPRVLGYAFNPLSLFFCHRTDGSLAAILYEVHNTFGERHSYLLAVAPGEGRQGIRQGCAKRLFVSPFLGMDMRYDFRVTPPGEGDGLTVSILGRDATGPLLAATLAARRRTLDDAALARVFVTHPLLTLKVIAGIHWEALRLWLKGVGLRRRPAPPVQPVSGPLPAEGKLSDHVS